MDVSTRDKGVYAFGPFRLDAVRRSLSRDGAKLTLPPRLFDTLLYLVENQGRVVSKDELFSAIWGGRLVEEANLTQTVFGLRKALGQEAGGAGFIATVPGRGYRFASPVSLESGAPSTAPAQATKLSELVSISEPGSDLGSVSAKPASGRMGRPVFPIAAVCAFAALCVAGVVWLALPARHQVETAASPSFDPPPHSVAVLPFTNVSGDPAQDYFSDGLSDELINELSEIDALRVVARTSAFYFKGKSATVETIARSLNVGAVLEGSVRREGERLRVTAELIDSRSGYVIWSHSFDRDKKAVLEVQQAIATAVSSALQVTLLGDDAGKLNLGGTENSFALDAYLRGRRLHESNDLASMKASLAAFDEAIRLDPNYAFAHVYRAIVLVSLYDFDINASPEQGRDILRLASQEANTAIALAPRLGMAHIAKAGILEAKFDFRSATKEEHLALQLSPRDPNVLRDASFDLFFISSENGDQWLALAKKAIELDPFSQANYKFLSNMYAVARQYDAALAALSHEEQLEQDVTTEDTYWYGQIEILKGRPEAAREACARQRDFRENACLALAYHALGMQSDAEIQLTKMRDATRNHYPYTYASLLAYLGDTQEALHWLQIAYEQFDYDLNGVRQDPLLASIRNTKEYKEIERKLNFPN